MCYLYKAVKSVIASEIEALIFEPLAEGNFARLGAATRVYNLCFIYATRLYCNIIEYSVMAGN